MNTRFFSMTDRVHRQSKKRDRDGQCGAIDYFLLLPFYPSTIQVSLLVFAKVLTSFVKNRILMEVLSLVDFS